MLQVATCKTNKLVIMAVAILVSFVFLAALANIQLAVSADFLLAGNQTGEELRQLIVSGSNGSIFVCSGGHLYQLSSQLEQLQKVPAEGCVAMSGTYDGNWLVLCFDNNTCAFHPANDLSVINSTFNNLSFYQNRESTVTALNSPPDLDMSFYVAAAKFENDPHLQLLQRGLGGVLLSRDFDSGSSSLQIARKIYHGFHYRGYSYFLSVVHINPPRLIITRVCNSDKERFSAVQELMLRSGSSTRPIVTGVSLIDSTLIVSFDGNVLNYDMMDVDYNLDLFFQYCLLIKHSALSNVPFSGNFLSCAALANTTTNPSLCNFNSSDESLILTLLSTPPINMIPLNRVVTSSVVVILESSRFLFIGVEKNFQYFVEKYLFQVTSLLYDIPVSSEVTGLIRPSGANYVYATAGNQIISLPLEICSQFNTCTSCVTNGDPLCGWCSVERKCSRSNECKNFDHTKRYIRQGQQTNCTDSVTVNRDDFNTNHVIRLSFIPTIPPPTLSGEEYLCVFSNTEHDVMFNTTLSTDDFTCNLTLATPELTEIKLTTNFSLYSNLTNTMFLSKDNAFTFYNCSLGVSCSVCVETEGNCGWCPYNFTCSLQSSDNDSSSSILTVSTNQLSYVDVCPVLNPPLSLLNYVQPVPVSTPLVINVTNIPEENSSIFYQCQIGEVVVPAKLINSSLSCDLNSKQMTLDAITGRETVSLDVLVTSAGNNYTLDTSTEETINVVFYKCSDLAVGCSSCLAQRLNTGFQCGWCEGSLTCKDYSENCSSVFNIISKNCDLPTITAIHPSSGPTTGGTTLTITGSDLGVEATDILSITVGNLTCQLNEDEYTAGRSIVCNTQNSTISQAQGNVSVVVTVRRNNESEMTSSRFQFKEPSVLSVFPTFGPAAGGTLVKLRGLNLNTGNKERTRVFLNSDELVSCEIILISSTEICCRWESFNTTTGVVHVSIDGTLVWNSSVTYQYLNNPIYEQVQPRNTIESGGIKLNFTGRFLNVSYIQRLVINNGEATGLCGLEGSTDTILVCLAPAIKSNRLENYTIVMDEAPGPDLTTISLQIDLDQDPSVTEMIKTVPINQNNTIEILGENITNVGQKEIQVLVGNTTCTIQSAVSTMIICIAPLRQTPVLENVTVMFGKYLNSSAGQVNYTFSTSPVTTSSTDLITIVIPAVVSVVVVFVVIVIIIFCFCYFTVTNYKGELQRAQQPIYMLPEISVMKMTDNIVYQNSKFFGRDAEPHLYEELPDNVEEQTQAEEDFAADSHTYDEPPENDDEQQNEDQPLEEMLREEEQVTVDQEEVNDEGEGAPITTRADEQPDVLITMETDEVVNQGEEAQKTDEEESSVVIQSSAFTGGSEDTMNPVEQQASMSELQSPDLPASAEDSRKEPNAEDDQQPGQFTAETNPEDDQLPGKVTAENSKNPGDDQLPGLMATDDFSEECDDYYVNEEPSSREITVHLKLLFQ